MKKIIKKIIKKIGHNKLTSLTVIVATLCSVVYLIGLFWYYKQNKNIDTILSASADYIAICSCILLLVQVFFYVRDSRRNEHRARKEFALGLANNYANDLLIDMAFIQNVLAKHYNEQTPQELSDILSNQSFENFTLTALKELDKLESYSNKIFKQAIKIDIIKEFSLIYNVIGSDELEKLEENSKENFKKTKDGAFCSKNKLENEINQAATRKFKCFVSCTMNKLEYFAMSVNQNIAEGDMLYISLHQTFIRFVNYVYPFICTTNTEFELFYTNIISLYKKWCEEDKKDKTFIKEKKQGIQNDIISGYTGKTEKMADE
ncbi:MAG: hypothetical protein IJE74_08100 [Clostridia bacterium]|nr:hypothetical protein [Clostridia bacterium]